VEQLKTMEQYGWIFWIVVGVILAVAETLTLGFVLFWFAIGAFAAALAGFLGFGAGVQFLVFAATSVILTLMSRKIFHGRYLRGNADVIKSGVDSLPGQIGTVSGASKGELHAGEVKVFGTTWTAFPEEGEAPLLEGEKVEVVEVKGASIYVRRVRELPEWRDE